MICYVYIRVNLAPPTLGAWSMAGLLGQPLVDIFFQFMQFLGCSFSLITNQHAVSNQHTCIVSQYTLTDITVLC